MVEWFDCASSIIAFCSNATADLESLESFKHTIIRLFSLLHAVAQVELESGKMRHEKEFKASTLDSLELIDVTLDDEYLRCLKRSDCKVELVHTWIQTTLVKNIPTGVLNVPPPILTRAFQELAQGMNRFHECCAIAETPFPFPYSQTTLVLLILHLIYTPVAICDLTDYASMAGCMSFLQVFALWSLYFIATEIEDPFGTDANDLDAQDMQKLMNNRLLMLADRFATTVPKMEPLTVVPTDEDAPFYRVNSTTTTHLSHLYSTLDLEEESGLLKQVFQSPPVSSPKGQQVVVLTPSSSRNFSSEAGDSPEKTSPEKVSPSKEPANSEFDIAGEADQVVL